MELQEAVGSDGFFLQKYGIHARMSFRNQDKIGGVEMSEFWSSLMWLLVGGAVGAAISYYFTRKSIEKQLKEHPPVTEKMIRAMFLQMGRKPSEAQIKQVMRSMQQ